jgi:hypothetical protein
MHIDRAVGFADCTQTKVVGPADQHSIELLYECLRSLPDGIPSGLGANGATDAVALRKERPLHPKNCVSQRYAMYVSIAGRLQELRPGDINLPVERLGKALRVDERTISYYARLATKDGYISLIAKYHKPSGTAAKYVFHSERFEMETAEELESEDSFHFHKDYKESQDCEESKDDHE